MALSYDTPEIAHIARREVAYREIGALIDSIQLPPLDAFISTPTSQPVLHELTHNADIRDYAASVMTAFLQLEANEPPEWLQYPRAAWRRPRLAPTTAGPALLVGEARAAAIEREHGGKVEVGICFPPETRPPAKKPLR